MSPAYKFVMLIDEDEIDNIINQKIIESNNFSEKVLVFQTGTEALDFLRTNAKTADNLPDLIFLDINMPIMDGFQFLEEFEKLDAPILDKSKIIMLSSSISPRDIDRAASNRFVKKYLNKPLNSRYLQAITI
jgi:CheY-like chemotaxis protein